MKIARTTKTPFCRALAVACCFALLPVLVCAQTTDDKNKKKAAPAPAQQPARPARQAPAQQPPPRQVQQAPAQQPPPRQMQQQPPAQQTPPRQVQQAPFGGQIRRPPTPAGSNHGASRKSADPQHRWATTTGHHGPESAGPQHRRAATTGHHGQVRRPPTPAGSNHGASPARSADPQHRRAATARHCGPETSDPQHWRAATARHCGPKSSDPQHWRDGTTRCSFVPSASRRANVEAAERLTDSR